jgi:hypothetical protein
MSTAKEAEGAPGLKWRTRSDGSRAPIWRARADLVKRGFLPKTVPLHYAPDDPALAKRCRALQAQMLSWAADPADAAKKRNEYDGTFASLVRLYETHADSPYRELGQSTQRTYAKTMELLVRNKGERRIDAVIGNDVRRWYKELVAASSMGWAYYTVNVLKAVLSFGSSLRIAECSLLRQELRAVRFSAGARRTEYLTADLVDAFCDKARELGFDWAGRMLRLQFDFAMRRRDVIGEYVREDDGMRWRDGLTWADVGKDGLVKRTVSKTRSKTGAVAVHSIHDYAAVAADLARTPPEQRIGPLVICHITGLPPTEEQARRFFRMVASKAGIPDTVWNMDARAGANTEAAAAGSTIEERMAMSTHSTLENSERYRRSNEEASRRAAAKRMAYRHGEP